MAQSSSKVRWNARSLAKINHLEAGAGSPRSTVVTQGRQRFSWTGTATALVAAFVVTSAIAFALDFFVVPGGVLLYILYNTVKPKRAISLSPETVSLWSVGAWTGSIKELVDTDDHNSLDLGEWTTVGSNLSVNLSPLEVAVLQEALAPSA